jgi:putative transposase
MVPDPAEEQALWRYHLIAEALGQRLRPRERGLIVRRIAGEEHLNPAGIPCRVSRNTLDRWIRRYRQHGLDGLRDRPRSDQGSSRKHPGLIEEAVKLRLERPERSAAQIAEILCQRQGVRMAERTLREQFQRRGLTRQQLLADQRTFGRYEAEAPNDRWIGDVLVGPFVPLPKAPGSVRARLFLLVDDHSRLLVHGRWYPVENLRAGQEVLYQAILRRGLPATLYTDNGSPYTGHQLARSCAILGIRLGHSRPYMPQGRGKQERLNRVIRDRFLLEIGQVGVAGFTELNDRFQAWVESYLNLRIHSETHQTPMERFLAGNIRPADPELLRQAFLWSEFRKVSRTGTVHFQGNEYQCDPTLRGRRVELRYRPEDLTRIEVWHQGVQFAPLTPLVIGRHVHPEALPPPRLPAEPTGTDYLGDLLAAYQKREVGQIHFRQLLNPKDQP